MLLRTKVSDACYLSVQLEFDFIDKAFEMGNIEGLTKSQLKNFIKARANEKMIELGYKSIYNDIDPNLLKQIEWFGHLTSGKTQHTMTTTQTTPISVQDKVRNYQGQNRFLLNMKDKLEWLTDNLVKNVFENNKIHVCFHKRYL